MGLNNTREPASRTITIFKNSFATYNTDVGDHQSTRLVIRKAEVFRDDEQIIICSKAMLPYRLNNIRIQYIVPNRDDIRYQYRLNESSSWSSWDSGTTTVLSALAEGDYTFTIRSIAEGNISTTNTFKFRIAPPWYRSVYAYVIYVLLTIFAAYSIFRWHEFILRKQKKKLLLKEQNSLRQQADKHREQLAELEQQRMQAEFNIVKQQLRNKTVELANKAKDNDDKNRLLLLIKEKFDLFEKEPTTSKLRLNEIRRLLNAYLKTDDKTFEIQIDELHQEFFKKLKERVPTLSGHDLRLCAYLRVGLNSKEIAEILNIQPSSSYISRSRLRKKLNLKPEEDLYDFLNKV